MKTNSTLRIALTSLALVCGFAASAEIIMYNGFPRTKDATYFKGFTIDNPLSTMRPDGVSRMMKNNPKSSTLSFPACFDGKVQSLRGGEDDAALYVADSEGGAASYAGTASGAKLLKLSDNCQSRTGSLHYRVLMKADQGALDAMKTSSTLVSVDNSQACGLLWTAPDYFTGAGENSNLRLTGGLAVSSENNIANTGIALNFLRGFLFAIYKDASGVSLRLFVWDSEATSLSEAKSITLVDSVTAGETYVCYAKIDIDAAGTLDIIHGMAQTVTGYDSTAAWPGSPFPRAITANLIGGLDVAGLNANFVAFGANKQAGTVLFDEACLATTADEAVVFDAANTDMGAVIAYDGFPCGTGAYSESTNAINKMSSLTTNAIYGFSDSKWAQAFSKSTPVTYGSGKGLALPEIYATHGISVTEGTSIGWSSSASQAMMVYRPLTSELLKLSVGTTLNMRFLLSITTAELGNNLAVGPDNDGTLMPGEVGVKAKVNYVGAGLLTLPATPIESGESEAPALCSRDNSCLIAFVKGKDGSVGLYLNLRPKDGDPVSYKITDVDATVGGTYLCFATIEVGTGSDGKEKIRAAGAKIDDVTDQYSMNWAPQNASKNNAIECELIDADSSSYPENLAVGGSVCGSGFKFDEFALSFGDWYPLVWAKYPRTGLMLILGN